MRLIAIAMVSLLAASGPAAAMTGAPASGSAVGAAEFTPFQLSKEKVKWKNGGCKYEFKTDKKGYKEKYKCK